VRDATAEEPDVGSLPVSVRVTLSGVSRRPVTVHYSLTPGTAQLNSDYLAGDPPGEVFFPPGTTSRSVRVPIVGDTIDENDETFSLTLLRSESAVISRETAVVTIEDDDGPTISINNVSHLEGSLGVTQYGFQVTLSVGGTQPVHVKFSTAGETARSRTDFAPDSGILTFTPPQTSVTVTIDVNGDLDIEGDETFTVDLSRATGGSILDGKGVGTIVNDDL